MRLATIRIGEVNEKSLTSLLFGHAKGAFVGAFDDQRGLLERSESGILLLDRIDRLPPSLQRRLADAMRTRLGKTKGGSRSYPINARILALSEHSPSGLVQKSVIDPLLKDAFADGRILLPPLRERLGDVPLLARHFLRMMETSSAKYFSLDGEATALLCSLDWPGNITQLIDALLGAAAQSRGSILRARDFRGSETTSEAENAVALSGNITSSTRLLTEHGHVRPLAEIESEVIRLAVARYDGRMTEIATRLGIGRSTLYRKLRTLGEKCVQRGRE